MSGLSSASRLAALTDRSPLRHSEEGRSLRSGIVHTIIYASACPDLRWTTEEVTCQGDTVVARLRARGTHQAESPCRLLAGLWLFLRLYGAYKHRTALS